MSLRRVLSVSVPAAMVATLAVLGASEVWVRATWDPANGEPGFFVAHPVRVEQLATGYDGWFAGVPVRTNALGFRDPREYDLAKGPRTFRILVLGDSVTFGHGSIFEHTYPYLTEQQLRAWRPDVDWQVWNLGVPGYNTSHELAQLLEVGPAWSPDLVVVGFFENDLFANFTPAEPTRTARMRAAAVTWVKRHVRAAEWFRRLYLTGRHRLLASSSEQATLARLADQDALLARPADVANADAQALTHPVPLAPGDRTCPSPPQSRFDAATFDGEPGMPAWRSAVAAFQRLHAEGRYHVAFFVNAAPRPCATADVFDPRGTAALDAHLLGILSRGTPAVSAHDAFLPYRPSAMPRAGGHSLGNANAVKADVLFRFLRDAVLPQSPGWTRLEETP